MLGFEEGVLSSVEVFERQLLRNHSDIVGEPCVEAVVSGLDSGLHRISTRKKIILQNEPREFCITRSFLFRLTHLLHSNSRICH